MAAPQVDSPLGVTHPRIRSHSRTSSNDSDRRPQKRARRQSEHLNLSPTSRSDIYDPPVAVEKPSKRTRTGCRTCRERHLKCDERRPDCGQCIKGKRSCSYERFLKWDKHIERFELPFEVPRPIDFAFGIRDESVTVASEYIGGEEWYALHDRQRKRTDQTVARIANQTSNNATHTNSPAESSWHGSVNGHRQSQPQSRNSSDGNHRIINSAANLSINLTPYASLVNGPLTPQLLPPESPRHAMIQDPVEAHFMKVYVEEMGSWMDTMNPIKYVSDRAVLDAMC